MQPEARFCTRCHEAVIVVWSTGGDRLTLNAAPTFPPHEHTYTGDAAGTAPGRSTGPARPIAKCTGCAAGPRTEVDHGP
jgi:hypothetical protein